MEGHCANDKDIMLLIIITFLVLSVPFNITKFQYGVK